MPPPLPPVLFHTMLSEMASVPLLEMPPAPSSSVNPEMLAVASDATSNIWFALSPLTTKKLAPGPLMVRFVLMAMVLARVIGELAGHDNENVTVSPEEAAATTASESRAQTRCSWSPRRWQPQQPEP